MRCFSVRRLRFQIGRSTRRPPTKAPNGPPNHHGNTNDSSQPKRVRRPRSIGVSVNRPVPVTRPTCRTPIAAVGVHSVISIRSTSLNGPTFVSQRNAVPTPRRRSVWNRMATASCIHETWSSIASTARPHLRGCCRDVDGHAQPWHERAGQALTDWRRSCAVAASGDTMLSITPVPRSNPAVVTSFGHR